METKKKRNDKHSKEVHCIKCGSTMNVAEDAIAGICWKCVAINNF